MDEKIINAFKKAKNYNSRSQFKKECGKEYRLLNKCGLYTEACSHMPKVNRENNRKWTYDLCKKISEKYTSKKEFQENDRGAYRASFKQGWLEEFTKNYRVVGHKYKRCLYVFEFSDKSAYIGLTYDVKKRFWQHHHEQNSKVYKKIKEINVGTGACAVNYACMKLKKAGAMDKPLNVQARGGMLKVTYESGNNHIFLQGPAVEVFSGEIEIPEEALQ